jgi:predicted CXXCH cytochrome family protein
MNTLQDAAATLAEGRVRYRLAVALFVCATLFAAVFFVAVAFIPAAVAADGMGACLDCHAEEGLVKKLGGGETMVLTVSRKELEGSVHRAVGCRGCHPAVNLDEHPGDRKIASLGDYRREVSKNCLGCHGEEGLRKRPQHGSLASGTITCVECHGSHGVRDVVAAKAGLGVNAYCMGCHARAITRIGPDGAAVSLAVDAAQLKGSVHPDHSCVECHPGFGKEAHPAADVRGTNRLTASQVCARCHADKMQQAAGSIHFSLLRAGRGGAPGCTDCHGAHGIGHKERYATLTGMPCRRCHQEVFDAYAGSMHGKARAAGEHLDAPLCVNCHRAHDVQGTGATAEHVRQACLGCHTAAATLHGAWLPNARLHLEAVSCAACHTPEAERVVALRFVDEKTGRAFSDAEITELLGTEIDRIKNPQGDGLDSLELWGLLSRLQERQGAGSNVAITARLEVARGLDAHRLAGKGQAVRSCNSCHEAGSPFFSRVAVKLADYDGGTTSYPAAQGVLVSAASVLPLPTFYAMGSTRTGILDYLLILAVLGGLAVPALHITARVLAARTRKGGE